LIILNGAWGFVPTEVGRGALEIFFARIAILQVDSALRLERPVAQNLAVGLRFAVSVRVTVRIDWAAEACFRWCVLLAELRLALVVTRALPVGVQALSEAASVLTKGLLLSLL